MLFRSWKHVLTSRTKRVFWTDVERAKIQNDLSQPNSPFVERDVSHYFNDFYGGLKLMCEIHSFTHKSQDQRLVLLSVMLF